MSETPPDTKVVLKRMDPAEVSHLDEIVDAEIVDAGESPRFDRSELEQRDETSKEVEEYDPTHYNNRQQMGQQAITGSIGSDVVPYVTAPQPVKNTPTTGEVEKQEIVDAELVHPPLVKREGRKDFTDVDDDEQKAIMLAPALKELEATPAPAAGSKEGLTFVTIDQSVDARSYAHDAAQRRLDEELNDNSRGRLRRFADKVWKGNMAKKVYLRMYENQMLGESVAEGSIYANETDDLSRRDAATFATIDRFKSDLDEARAHEATGERREVNEDPELATGIKELVRRGVTDHLDDDAMQEEWTRFLTGYRETHTGDQFGEGLIEANNMSEIMKAVKGSLEHGESLDSVLENMRIITGESRSGVRTEARLDKIDKIADRIASSKLGLLVSPEALGVATIAAASVAKWGARSAAHAGAILLPVGGALLAGGLAAYREKLHVQDENIAHKRQMAQGRDYEVGDKRRAQMEATVYESVTAQELITSLEGVYGDDVDLSGEDALRAALDTVGAIETRINYSEMNHEDRIDYSDTLDIEAQRFQLVLARAQAKSAINNQLESMDNATRAALGFVGGIDTLDAWVGERSSVYTDAFETDKDAKDAAYRRIRNKRVVTAGVVGFGVSLVGGQVLQELRAALPGSSTVGLVDQLRSNTGNSNGEAHQTGLASLVDRVFDRDSVPQQSTGSSETYTPHPFGHNTISVSDNMGLDKSADGSFSLKGGDGTVIADHLSADADGNLTPESLTEIKSAGLAVDAHTDSVRLAPTTEHTSGSLKEYLQAHKDGTTKVHRQLFLDSGSPNQPVGNALRMDAGGVNGTGVTADGDYQFDISRMTADGSSHGLEVANVKELAKSGDIKLAISPSADTQHNVIMVNLDADGKPTIPKGSEASAFFKTDESGHMVFEGKYAEIVQSKGVDSNGVEQIRPIATVVGTDNAKTSTFGIDRQVTHSELRTEYRITNHNIATSAYSQDLPPEAAPITPIIARTSMGATGHGRQTEEAPAPNPGLAGIESAPHPTTELEATQVLPAIESDDGTSNERPSIMSRREQIVRPEIGRGNAIVRRSLRDQQRRRAIAGRRPGGSPGPESRRGVASPPSQNRLTLEQVSHVERHRAEVAARHVAASLNRPLQPGQSPMARVAAVAAASRQFGEGGFEVEGKVGGPWKVTVRAKGVKHYIQKTKNDSTSVAGR